MPLPPWYGGGMKAVLEVCVCARCCMCPCGPSLVFLYRFWLHRPWRTRGGTPALIPQDYPEAKSALFQRYLINIKNINDRL